MKTTGLSIISASAASLLAIMAVAQDAPNPNRAVAPDNNPGATLDPEIRRLTEFVYNHPKSDGNLQARNVGDRDEGTRTPPVQGKGQADVDATAQIHKAIVAGKHFSEDARNVQISTLNGRVTLQGPVDTTEEKRRIGEIAARIAHPGTVDNQLDVTFATASK